MLFTVILSLMILMFSILYLLGLFSDYKIFCKADIHYPLELKSKKIICLRCSALLTPDKKKLRYIKARSR